MAEVLSGDGDIMASERVVGEVSVEDSSKIEETIPPTQVSPATPPKDDEIDTVNTKAATCGSPPCLSPSLDEMMNGDQEKNFKFVFVRIVQMF